MSPMYGKYRCFSILHLAHGGMDGVQRITDDTTLEESGGNYESLYHCLRCKVHGTTSQTRVPPKNILTYRSGGVVNSQN